MSSAAIDNCQTDNMKMPAVSPGQISRIYIYLAVVCPQNGCISSMVLDEAMVMIQPYVTVLVVNPPRPTLIAPLIHNKGGGFAVKGAFGIISRELSIEARSAFAPFWLRSKKAVKVVLEGCHHSHSYDIQRRLHTCT